MTTQNIREQLREVADHIQPTASIEDAMYELYVRQKVMIAREAAERGECIPHEDVKRRFQQCPE